MLGLGVWKSGAGSLDLVTVPGGGFPGPGNCDITADPGARVPGIGHAVGGILISWLAMPGPHGKSIPGIAGLGNLDTIPIPGLGESTPGTPGLSTTIVASGILGFLTFAFSNVNIDPNRVCCITGNLDKTSALYILMRPVNTFDHIGTPEMFHN